MPTFRGLAEYAAEGCLIKPLWHQWVMEGKAASLNLLVERPVRREPDGWFHASSHPTASDRDLYRWMTGQHEPEQMTYEARMAVMFGSLQHAVFEAFLERIGVAVPLPPGDCPACGRPRRQVRARPSSKYCTEHGALDKLTRARCHLDSILDFSRGADPDRSQWYGFDLKTIYPFAFSATKTREAVRDMDTAQFKDRWPHYWAQMQECMRITGLRRYIVFFMTMGSPWETREFHVGFDPAFAVETERKYLRILDHVERGVPVVL